MGASLDSGCVVTSIRPRELAEILGAGRALELYDVRTPAEYRELHALPARLVPLDALDPKAVLAERAGNEDKPLYVICRTGGRGRKACEKLLAAGCRNVVNIEGGTLAWEQAGLPVVRGKKTISLERQVRIAAGALVVLGTALGAFVHPAFLGLAAFVGAGLVFAGVTDNCGMAMLLARMPWNRAGDPASNEAACAGPVTPS
jgi:rhodanese-related sulfurtransferase